MRIGLCLSLLWGVRVENLRGACRERRKVSEWQFVDQ